MATMKPLASSKHAKGVPKLVSTNSPLRDSSRKRESTNRIRGVLAAVVCCVSFFTGAMWSGATTIVSLENDSIMKKQLMEQEALILHLQRRVKLLEKQHRAINNSEAVAQNILVENCTDSNIATPPNPFSNKKFVTGVSWINKENFTQTFDLGVPIDENKDEVLLLYKDPKPQPSASDNSKLSALEATKDCHVMHVLLTETHRRYRQCIAIVPQATTSFHLQNWMRVDFDKRTPVQPQLPLNPIGRLYRPDGYNLLGPPFDDFTKRHLKMLSTYLENMDQMKQDLSKLISKDKVYYAFEQTKAIVVMVCNLGQSELLVNFACSAKSRNISLDHVLIFATDAETKELAQALGFTSYHNESIFGHIPKDAAKEYGDKDFATMMMAKMYCVHIVSLLGYDVLFQDVDIVWYHDPLVEYFRSKHSDGFDLYFQDDGQRGVQYAPYSANSGFYYVKNNRKTRFFLQSVVMSGDLVLHTGSHQRILIAVLSEHASLFGLRAKVLKSDQFPCGKKFKHEHEWMKQFLVEQQHDPFIFHVNWTPNKQIKLEWLQQMGEWFVKERCTAFAVKEKTNSTTLGLDVELTKEACCSAEPLISCHYRDLPSKIPCKDSAPMVEGRKSFW